MFFNKYVIETKSLKKLPFFAFLNKCNFTIKISKSELLKNSIHYVSFIYKLVLSFICIVETIHNIILSIHLR